MSLRFVFFFGLISTSISDISHAQPTVRELEERLLASRQSLQRGRVVVRTTYTVNRSSDGYLPIERTYRVDFDGSQIRSIVDWKHPKWTKTTRALMTGQDAVCEFSSQLPVEVWKLRELPHSAMRQDAWDPRLLGLVDAEVSLLHYKDLSTALWFFSDKGAVVSSDRVRGEKAWRIDYRPEPRVRVAIWVAPEYGNNPVRLETERELEAGGKASNVVDSEYVRTRPGNHWFPKRVIFRQSLRGELQVDQVAIVEKAEFNIPIEAKTFSIQELGLPPGRNVMERPLNRMMIWDGSKLLQRAADPEFGANDRAYPIPRSMTSRFFWMGAALCSIGAILLIARQFFLSSSRRSNLQSNN